MGCTTVAHFSDIHAFSLAGVPPWAFFNKRLAGAANLFLHRRSKHPFALFEALVDDINRVGPDQVVVTGDITNLSLDSEFSIARGAFNRFRLATDNISVIPGNHDVYVWIAHWRRSFQRFFEPYCRSDSPLESDRFPLVRIRGELAIVGVSTAFPSPVPFADGWVGTRQLSALAKALRATGRDGKFRIVLIHHPPVTNRMATLRGLRDRDRLQEVFRTVGAELILHGHEHRDLQTTVDGPNGPIPVIGVGSATYDHPAFDRRARYNLYRIEGTTFNTETRVHDPSRNEFVPFSA